MRVDVMPGAGVEAAAELRAGAERRVALALGRFGGRIRRVTVRFSASGDAPAAAARCRVAVALTRGAPVVAEREAACALAALEEAVDAAGRALSRRVATEPFLRAG